MSGSRYLRIEGNSAVRRLVLSRPDVRNAFNAELIAEITSALQGLKRDSDLRALVIAADGQMFCAGADFHWMGGLRDAGYEENLADSRKLFDMFSELYRFPTPTIARLQGGAYGGGAGLVACCDIVVMANDATMAFSEVRIGLIPATISPFVVRKIGEGRAREMFLTGLPVDAEVAFRIGLANRIVGPVQLDQEVDNMCSAILKTGPQASRLTKEVLRDVPSLSLHDARDFTALRIAEQRLSDEGQEGMSAFLEKRTPSWTK